jgi:3',5'-cyclic AMP phosphodiesterase CpdA
MTLLPRRPLPLLCLLVLLILLAAWPRTPAGDTEAKAQFLVLPYLQLPTPDSMTVLWETNRKQPGQVEYGPTRDLGQVAESKRMLALQEVKLTGLKPGTTYHYRVRSGSLLSDVYSFRTAPPAGTRRWRMAFYGDSRSFPAIHARVAEGIRKANVDLIVHSGDIVYNGKSREAWRKEFFEPLGDLLRSVPWVSTIGNHERNADEYFSYVALPGNERYFTLDWANVRLLCLDSNSWVQKGRDSEQGRFLARELARKRDADWTFAVFHHPLFSAHVNRPAIALRWEWAPLFLDPAHRVDAVLTGHDHFYARMYRMGQLADRPQPGVLFLTSAGGGAPLYRTYQRDFVAREKSEYHFVLLEADGDRITFTAIDVNGREIDRFTLTKQPAPADEFCAYEVEELREFLRKALAAAAPLRPQRQGPTTFDSELRVPTRFKVPVSGQLVWDEPRGWKLKATREEFRLEPGQALTIPFRAEVAAGPYPRTPRLTIQFAPGRFRNRVIALSPYQLTGPERVTVKSAGQAPVIDGQLTEETWQQAETFGLLGMPPDGGRDDEVRFRADRDFLYVGATLADPANLVRVKPRDQGGVGDRGLLSVDNVSLSLARGRETHNFVVTPEQRRFYEVRGGDERSVTWAGLAGRTRQAWQVEMAIPRNLFPDWSGVRINFTHRRRGADSYQDLHLCPTWSYLQHPDRIPDIRGPENTEGLSVLVLP